MDNQRFSTAEDVLWWLQGEGIKVNDYTEGAEDCEVSMD